MNSSIFYSTQIRLRKAVIVFFLIVLNFSLTFAQSNLFYSWLTSGEASFRSIAVNSLGESYSTGQSFSNELILGGYNIVGRPYSINSVGTFIVKRDINGYVKWVKNFSSATGSDYGQKVVCDNFGNIILLGVFFSDSIIIESVTLKQSSNNSGTIYVAKFQPDGNLLWAHTINSLPCSCPNVTPYARPTDLTIDVNNNVIFSGNYQSDRALIFAGDTLLTHSTVPSYIHGSSFIAKVDSLGSPKWIKKIATNGNLNLESIASDGNSGIVFGGMYSGPISISGMFNFTSQGGWDMIIGKADSVGTVTLAKSIQGNGNIDYVRQLVVDSSNNIILVGVTNSPNLQLDGTLVHSSFSNNSNDINSVVLKTDGNLVPIWNKSLTGSGDDNIETVLIQNNNVVIGGGTTSTICLLNSDTIYSNGNSTTSNLLLIFLDSAGNHVSSITGTGSGWDIIRSIKNTVDSGILILGESYGSDTIVLPELNANIILGNSHWDSGFLLKLSSSPTSCSIQNDLGSTVSYVNCTRNSIIIQVNTDSLTPGTEFIWEQLLNGTYSVIPNQRFSNLSLTLDSDSIIIRFRSKCDTLIGNPNTITVYNESCVDTCSFSFNKSSFAITSTVPWPNGGSNVGAFLGKGNYLGDAFDDLVVAAPGFYYPNPNSSGFPFDDGFRGAVFIGYFENNIFKVDTFKPNMYDFGYDVAGGFDFNGDGKDDLMITSSSCAYLYLGNDSLLQSIPNDTLCGLPWNIQNTAGKTVWPVKDLNCDGYDEVLVSSNGLRLFYGNSMGKMLLAYSDSFFGPSNPNRFTDFDYNNDGFSDILIGSHRILIHPGTCNGRFIDTVVNNNFTHDFGDVNNDGFYDAIIDGKIYLNDGNNNFNNEIFQTSGYSSTIKYDVNLDGFNDYLEIRQDFSLGSGFSIFVYYFSNADSTFHLGDTLTLGIGSIYYGSNAGFRFGPVLDINGDSIVDFFAAHELGGNYYNGHAKVWLGKRKNIVYATEQFYALDSLILSGYGTLYTDTVFVDTIISLNKCDSVLISEINIIAPLPISKQFNNQNCGDVTLVAPLGFDSYLWSNGDTSRSIQTNDEGIFHCTMTFGPIEYIDSIFILHPKIDAPDTIYVNFGDSVLLSALIDGVHVWSWSNGDTATQTYYPALHTTVAVLSVYFQNSICYDTVVIIPIWNGCEIRGRLIYPSHQNWPLPNQKVVLYNSSLSIVDSARTNTIGEFILMSIDSGSYYIVHEASYPWGGVNGTDALMIVRHYTSRHFLTGMGLEAAKVNNRSNINSLEALRVAQRCIGIVDSFASGDWLIDTVPVTINFGDTTKRPLLNSLCFGDVNASFLPLLLTRKSHETIYSKGILPVRNFENYKLPLFLNKSVSSGAFTLRLQLPDNITVRDVSFSSTIQNDLKNNATNNYGIWFKQMGDILSIVWFDESPMSFDYNNPIIELSLQGDFNNRLIKVVDLEFADEQARVISGLNLSAFYPELATSSNVVLFPNPSFDNATLSVSVDCQSTLMVTVFDAQGKVILSNISYSVPSGNTVIPIPLAGLLPGLYYLKSEIYSGEQLKTTFFRWVKL